MAKYLDQSGLSYFWNKVKDAVAVVKTTLDTHTSDATIHISASERVSWGGKENAGVAASLVSTHNSNVTAHNDIRTVLNNKADKETSLGGYGITDAYTKTEVDAAIAKVDKEVDLSGYATTASVEKATSEQITSIFNTLVSSSEKYIGTANLAALWALIKPLIAANTEKVTDLQARVDLLELILTADVSANSYYVTFSTLDSVNVEGVWNADNYRIDF